jgi:phosphoribosylformylglycinamidine cyclo-ligase
LRRMTYKDAGVDIELAESIVQDIKQFAEATRRPGVIKGVGGFGGLFGLDVEGMKKPVLVSGTDGVGTKLFVAQAVGKHDTVGIDLVAMNVNDISTCGAEALFFLDYIAMGKLDRYVVLELIRGISEGCRMAGCALIGGELAEMPGLYKPGEYDIVGFAVGVVEEEEVIDGSGISEGDIVIGIGSSGLHSNGYSLARKVLLEVGGIGLEDKIPELGGKRLYEELLEPTRIYQRSVLDVIKIGKVKGIAHITGGGIPGNLVRILPQGCSAHIKKGSWPVHPIFGLISEIGNVPEEEMFRTFNMGIGMIMVVHSDDADAIVRRLWDLGEKAYPIGEIRAGEREVTIT